MLTQEQLTDAKKVATTKLMEFSKAQLNAELDNPRSDKELLRLSKEFLVKKLVDLKFPKMNDLNKSYAQVLRWMHSDLDDMLWAIQKFRTEYIPTHDLSELLDYRRLEDMIKKEQLHCLYKQVVGCFPATLEDLNPTVVRTDLEELKKEWTDALVCGHDWTPNYTSQGTNYLGVLKAQAKAEAIEKCKRALYYLDRLDDEKADNEAHTQTISETLKELGISIEA